MTTAERLRSITDAAISEKTESGTIEKKPLAAANVGSRGAARTSGNCWTEYRL